MPGSCEATPNNFYAESRNFRRKIQLTPHGCCVRCREAADTICHSGAASLATTRAQGGEARWPHSPCSAVRLFHTHMDMNMNMKTHWASVVVFHHDPIRVLGGPWPFSRGTLDSPGHCLLW